MKNEIKLPCEECASLELTCCHNPRILFSVVELDKVITHYPKMMEGKVLFRGEIPGWVYILNKPPEGVRTVGLDYCSFYDADKGRCSIYEQRPAVCKTYGDPKYNECPYEDYAEPGQLTQLKKDNPELSMELHNTAKSDPEAFFDDYVDPFAKALGNSDPKYMEFWESLTRPNFINKEAYVS